MTLPSSLIQLIPGLAGHHIRISDPTALEEKLKAFKTDGIKKLQVITDYDMTITKHHVNGIMTNSSFGLFTLTNNLPDGFVSENRALKAKYFPIEFDPKIPVAEKIPHMVKWYAETERMFTGLIWNLEDLKTTAKNSLPELRDGSHEFFRLLREKQVPVVVLSAGLGDVIKAVLSCHGIDESDNFHIVSNFFKIDDQGIINGMGCHENGVFIHPFNKNGLGCEDYYKNRGTRSNIILMGDSIGDANMDEGVPNVENVLKIGFLYGSESHVAEALPNFLSHFDIVLIDDQTMQIPMEVLSAING